MFHSLCPGVINRKSILYFPSCESSVGTHCCRSFSCYRWLSRCRKLHCSTVVRPVRNRLTKSSWSLDSVCLIWSRNTKQFPFFHTRALVSFSRFDVHNLREDSFVLVCWYSASGLCIGFYTPSARFSYSSIQLQGITTSQGKWWKVAVLSNHIPRKFLCFKVWFWSKWTHTSWMYFSFFHLRLLWPRFRSTLGMHSLIHLPQHLPSLLLP